MFSDDQLQVLLASSAPPVTTDDRKHGLLCCDHLERDKTVDHDALLSTGVVTMGDQETGEECLELSRWSAQPGPGH